MSLLNSFQTTCEDKLRQVLLSSGRRLEYRRVKEGNIFKEGKEIFLEAKIENTDIRLWIYDDGAEFGNETLDRRFEAPDYRTPEDLVEAFIRELAAELETLGT